MKVAVFFVGICTHIKDTPLPLDNAPVEPEPPGTISRVVLVDASQGLRIGDWAIPPHTALVYIPPQFIAGEPERIDGLTKTAPGTWTMSGVQLRLGNSSDALTWTESYRCLPSLTMVAAQPLDLSGRVVEGGDAACVFCVPAGILEAYTCNELSQAVIGKLSLESDPAALIVTRIWDQAIFSIALQRAEVDGIEKDPEIFVANIGTSADTAADFMLHYGVTTWTPDRLVLPTNTCAIPLVSDADATSLGNANAAIRLTGLTFGCSNSTYP